ncbi:ATP-binding protein [Pseudoalteromonas sp. PPB1]|uniref:ATP-binding protein n=1 Tax=Pseudoalteromonas sp. PPB1 TaxID=2756136 RepID=UPI001890D231|nr:ATP-binding protein [Pseudoalteromonas sp. PPB1]
MATRIMLTCVLILSALLLPMLSVANSIDHLGSRFFAPVGDKGKMPVITDLIQDKQGVFWLTTQEGLFRYDGTGFVRFVHQKNEPNSLVANYVYRLWEAPNGHIWIGSRAKGLSVFDPVSGTFTNQSPVIEGEPSSNQIFDIKGSDTGQVMIATTAGVVWQDPTQGYKGLFPNISGCLYEQSRPRFFVWQDTATFWLIGSKQLCKVAVDIEQRALTGTQIKVFEQGELATALLEGDIIWLAGRSGGIHKYNIRDNIMMSVTASESFDVDISKLLTFELLKVDDNTLWAGTYLGGILVIDRDTAKVVKVISHQDNNAFSIGGNNASAFLADSSGLLWVGTWGTGLYKLNAVSDVSTLVAKVPDFKNTLSATDVYRVMQLNNGDLWVALSGGGVDVYSAQTGHITPLTEPAESVQQKLVHMQALRNGDVWLAGLSELLSYQPDTNTISTYKIPTSDTIRSVLVDESDTIWVGMERSLWRFSKQTQRFEQLKTVSNEQADFQYFVEDMQLDNQNRLWIGSGNGVYLVEAQSRQLVALGVLYPELVGIIAGVYQDSKERLWVANYSTGALLTVNGSSSELTINDVTRSLFKQQSYLKEGFKIYSILEEDAQGRMWASGLVIESDLQLAYKLHVPDMTIWQNSQIMTREGLIVAAGPQGVVTIDTNRWQPWDYDPRVIITRLEVNNMQYNKGVGSLHLSANTKSIRVDYAATDYLAPEKIQYAYQLSGYDEQWHYTRESHITYTNLSPGRYQLKLKSTNSDGRWSEKVTLLPIIQLPAWYQTYWFYALCMALLLMLMYGALKLRTAALEQQKARLQSLVDERTRYLIELGEMGQNITSSLDLELVLKIIHSRITALLDSFVFMVGVVNTKAQTLDMVAWYEGDECIENAYFKLNELNRPGPWCVANRKEIIAHTQAHLSECLGELVEPVVGVKTESIIYLPLVINDEVIGCLSVQSTQQYAYPENTINMLRTISAYAAIALENARAHTYLINAQEMLIESGKQASLGYLVSGVAHEINTPVGIALTTISSLGGQAEQLKQKLADNQVRKSDIESFVEFSIEADKLMQSSLNRCAKLVQDFKNISADQFDSGKREVQLKTYLEDVLSAFSGFMAESEVVYNITGDNPDVSIDPGILSQIMSNLIKNAINHAFDGELWQQQESISKCLDIHVATKDRTIEVCFADNGIGMDEETKELIFVPFFTTKRGTERIGLGLNIVYNLTVSGLGGTLQVDSKPNEGTRFTLCFGR